MSYHTIILANIPSLHVFIYLFIYLSIYYNTVLSYQNHRNFVDAFTRGIKENKRYLWYSVWDIWRRLPFVAVNLIISVTTVSIIVVSKKLNVELYMTIQYSVPLLIRITLS